jgi:hypothetical protein
MNLPVLLRFVQVLSPVTLLRSRVRLRTAPSRELSPVGLFVAIRSNVPCEVQRQGWNGFRTRIRRALCGFGERSRG